MTSEPNTNIGSTSTNQSTYKLPKEQESVKKEKEEIKLFAFITETQAKTAGGETLELFKKYDVNNNKELDLNEYNNYLKGYDPTTTRKKMTKEEQEEFFNNLTPEKFKEYISKGFKYLGIDDEISQSIAELENKEKKNLNQLAAEHFDIDLSKYSTEEEKKVALENAIQKKYKIPNRKNSTSEIQKLIDTGEIDKIDNNDSIYLKHVKRLRDGKFDDSEKEISWLKGKDLTADQLDKFAQLAARKEQIVELSKYFAQGDNESKKILINNIENLDSGVQTGIIGAAVLSANDNKTRTMYAELLKNQDIKLTSKIGQKIFDMTVKTLQTNLSSEASIELTTDSSKFETKEDALQAYKIYDASEQYKVDKGIITEEEYNQNYVNLYAANAYKVELASDAYKYVMDNANDTNRSGAMNMLASNAYQIKDESQRNGAISNLKNSNYYNDSVQENLDKSYAKKLESTYSKTDSSVTVQPKSYQNQTNPINNNETDYYTKVINSTIDSGNDDAVKELTIKTFDDINKKEGQTPKQKKLGIQRGMQILTKLISNNKLQNSPYEGIVLNKLSALPAPTLLNMFLGSNEKVQGYFYKNNLITPLTIAMNSTSEEIYNLPDNIKEKVMVIKDENYQNKPNME